MKKVIKSFIWAIILIAIFLLFQAIVQYEIELAMNQFTNSNATSFTQLMSTIKNYDWVCYLVIVVIATIDITF